MLPAREAQVHRRRHVGRDVEGGVHEREVRERLREVAEQPLDRGRTPRRAGRRRCARSRSRSNSCTRLVVSPEQRVAVGEPERARQERALAGRQAVDAALLAAVAEDEAVVRGARARSPRPCRAMRGSVAGRKPTSGISSRLASSSFESYDCVKEPSFVVEAAVADLGVDLVADRAPAVDGPVEPVAPRPFAPRGRTRPTPSPSSA